LHLAVGSCQDIN